jgi:hypothetical protein
MKIKNWTACVEGNEKRSKRTPKLSTRRFSSWKKKTLLQNAGNYIPI